MASRYLLPASLVLLTLSIDIKGIINLGPKAIIMFLAGTFGIVIGGPLTIILLSYISPDLVGGSGPDEIWKGLATIAGSWIGGGANQTVSGQGPLCHHPVRTKEIKGTKRPPTPD